MFHPPRAWGFRVGSWGPPPGIGDLVGNVLPGLGESGSTFLPGLGESGSVRGDLLPKDSVGTILPLLGESGSTFLPLLGESGSVCGDLLLKDSVLAPSSRCLGNQDPLSSRGLGSQDRFVGISSQRSRLSPAPLCEESTFVATP